MGRDVPDGDDVVGVPEVVAIGVDDCRDDEVNDDDADVVVGHLLHMDGSIFSPQFR